MNEPSSRQLGVDAATILDTAHEAFVAMGVDGRIVEWNRAAEHTFGWERSEVLGRELADVLIPEHLREGHRNGLARYLETGEGPVLESRVELPALHRDGREIEVEITISALNAESGRFFHAFLHDISERVGRDRLLAAQLRVTEVLATAAPDRAMRRMLDVLCREGGWRYGGVWMAGDTADMLHDYTAWWDAADGLDAFESASRAAGFYRGRGMPGVVWERGEPMWHWPAERSVDFPRIAMAERLGLRSGLAVPLRAGNEVVAVLELFARHEREPTDQQVSLLVSIAPHLGEYVARRRAERAAEDDKDAFVAMVSHELRTPLTSITGFAQTALERGEQLAPEQLRQFMEIILQQGRRLSRLVDDLLTMSALQSRGIQPDIVEVDLAGAARETLDELGCTDRFELRILARGAVALADRDLCKQVLVNFVQNAVRYGRPPFAVEIAQADAQCALLAVTDCGPGVPVEFAPRLFDKFARAEEVTDLPGTGLGLSIVRAVAEVQGGRAWYEPMQPNGSRFVLELPLAQPLVADHEESA